MKKITSIRCLAHLPKVRSKARTKENDGRIIFLNQGISSEYNESLRALLTRVTKLLE